MRPENFDINTSSIDQKNDDDDDQPKENWREKVSRLETELEEFHRLHSAMENQNRSLKGELQQIKVQTSNASL